MTLSQIESQQDYTDVRFRGVDCQQSSISDSVFSECEFHACNFSETTFENCRFIDCSFDDCIMPLLNVSGTTFGRVTFKQCNLLGINWTTANWSDWATKIHAMTFEQCNLKYGVFLGLDLQKMQMKDCVAHEVNFAEADLTKADFAGTDLAGAVFIRSNLTQASFVGASNYALNLNDNISKGTRFSLPEAIRLLNHLDIVLVDPITTTEIQDTDLDEYL